MEQNKEGSLRPGVVFISYASADAKIAEEACTSLESRGITCWIAPRDVAPGSLYAEAIIRAINDADVLLLVLSNNAVASAHVGKEIERASSKRKKLITLRTDLAPLSPALEYFLSESQWIDGIALGIPEAMNRVAGTVAAEPANNVDRLAPAKELLSPSGGRRGLRRSGTVVGIGLGVALLGIISVAYYRPGHRVANPHASDPVPSASEQAPDNRSIAVIPFVDLSQKKDQEYFAAGIAEEVLNRLAQVPSLKIVGRTSSFQFNGHDADPAQVGKILGVAYILQGTVRKEEGRVRVTAQLIEASSGVQRWSDRFDSAEVDALNIQDTIATEIASALKTAVDVDAGQRSTIRSPAALDAYLRGLQSLGRGTRDDCLAAVAQFQRVLGLEPTFSPAAMELARTYVAIGYQAWLPTKIAFERAREAAQKAVELDPKSARAHAALAHVHIAYDWEWSAAQREIDQAFALAPRDAYAVSAASSLASALGRWDEARQLGIEAISLDPLSAESQVFLGFQVYLRSGDYSSAERSFRRALEIAPGGGSYRYFLGESLLLQGQADAALKEFNKESLDDGRLEGTAMVESLLGHKAQSDAALMAAVSRNGSSWPSEIARVYAFRGERDQAFSWLEKAFDGRDEDLYFVKNDPLLKSLSSDPRYVTFLRKMNLPE